ncbi:cytochrome P450 [Cadophora sp. DSE1049]|nr:cytochrome P450 [Cadophora sp. DSE1049]
MYPFPGQRLPIVGNIFDIKQGSASTSLYRMANIYGPIFKLNILDQRELFINGRDLLAEIFDESKFTKEVAGSLGELRNGFLNDGLITSYSDESAWKIAHRIVMPAFGPLKIREMFDPMKDIISQLCLKWARLGPSHIINVTEDLTRMALDVVGRCTMNYRFNSFYNDKDTHPFVNALNDVLLEADARSWRLPLATQINVRSKWKYQENINSLRETTKDDLLATMMNGRDSQTGLRMTDESLIDNVLTFLVAGHETTSGTLAFVIYFLLRNPGALVKAQQELDRVVGEAPLQVEHLSQLPYIDAIIRETLRFQPTVPVFCVKAIKDSVLGGKYLIKKGDHLSPLLFAVQRDPKDYGDDADQWKPERMLPENFTNLPPYAWKPFGNGLRACVGRPFAWQEAQIALAMLLQTFNFDEADPSYQLSFKDAITINPIGFKVSVHLRDKGKYTQLLAGKPSTGSVLRTDLESKRSMASVEGTTRPISVAYGSDNGTCESLAHPEVVPLNLLKEEVPEDRPLVIFTSSYNGISPQNAIHFFSWLESLTKSEMRNVKYAVFGIGSRDWAETFQRVPTLVDELLYQRGGQRIVPLKCADVAVSDTFSEFETWEDKSIWPALQGDSPPPISHNPHGSTFSVKITYPRLKALQQTVSNAVVISTKILTSPNAPVKKHMEIQLPPGTTYKVGDYLAVLPINPQTNIQRVLARFHLAADSVLDLTSHGPRTLTSSEPISAGDLFGQYVELSHPASSRNIQRLADLAPGETIKAKLRALAETNGTRTVSVLDIVEKYEDIDLTIGEFLTMIPPLKTRLYSISSSPLHDAQHATITWSVVNEPSTSDQTRGFFGVASDYLAELVPGNLLHVALRSPKVLFTLPQDPETTPDFCQERAIQIREGRHLAPAILFFGCRTFGIDDLYLEEFKDWEAAGAVVVHHVYSRPNRDVLQLKQDSIAQYWRQGAEVYVCGSPRMAEDERLRKGITRKRLSNFGQDRFFTEIFS